MYRKVIGQLPVFLSSIKRAFHKSRIVLVFLVLILPFGAFATTLVVQSNTDVVGKMHYGFSEAGETLAEVGRRNGIGHNAMQIANPSIIPNQALAHSTRLLIPSAFILPAVPRNGIVINLSEFRLYYFLPNENVVITFPIGIGRVGWDTPVGITKVVSKQANPDWRPTEKVRQEAEKNGFPIPEFFPAGPNNPLGKHVLRLGWPTFLIHGTNKVDGIGERISAGCIRMQAEDIEYLYNLVKIGTKVRIINEPVKIAQENGRIYFQMYPELERKSSNTLKTIFTAKMDKIPTTQWKTNKEVLNEFISPSGVVKFFQIIQSDNH